MVDLDQEADFIGKAALKKIKAEGISRKLVGVEIGGDRLGAYKRHAGTVIGKVTSVCWSPG